MNSIDNEKLSQALLEFSIKNGISKTDAEKALSNLPFIQAQVSMLGKDGILELTKKLDEKQIKEIESIISSLK